MSRRWVIAAAAAAALVVGATGFAASSGPPGSGNDLPGFFFGPRMARAEVVMVIGAAVHDFRVDQGRVTAVRPDSIDLLERDGTNATVPVAPDARIIVSGGPPALASIRRGMFAVTVRDGNAPAQTVRASGGRRFLR